MADPPDRLRSAVEAALGAASMADGHVAVELVSPARIHGLNRAHRGHDAPTDVLSFPVDETAPAAGPRELGDIVVCPELADDLVEATVHGALHLCGFDHETDTGEMLALQERVMRELRQ